MIKQIVFATNNSHKLDEVRKIAAGEIEILSLRDIGFNDEIEETADTLSGNALLKARCVKERTGYDCFADDTGLMVDALDGRPGVHTARYAGADCNPVENVDRLLAEMEGKENRKAHFCTVIALISEGKETLLEGRIDGIITTCRRGLDGFGYDPVFEPDNSDGKTFAEMGNDMKNKISHRGLAMQKLMHELSQR